MINELHIDENRRRYYLQIEPKIVEAFDKINEIIYMLNGRKDGGMEDKARRYVGIYRNGETIVVYAESAKEAKEKCENKGWHLWKVLQLPTVK